MSFKDALFKLIDNNGKEILKEPFKTRCILSDYIGSDYYQSKLMEAFLEINTSYDLCFIFLKKGLIEGRKFLTSIYVTFKDKYSKKEFVDSINPISEYLFPKEYKEYEENKVVIKKANVKKEKKANKIDEYYYINVDSFDVFTSNGDVLFEYGGHKYVEVYLNGKKQKPSKYQVINNTLIIKDSGNITIKANKRVFESLNIVSKNGNVDIELPRLNSKSSKSINVLCDEGNISVKCDCENLNVNTKHGDILLYGSYKQINALTSLGKVKTILYKENRKDMNINLQTDYGEIRGDFIDTNLRQRIYKIFGKDKMFNSIVYSDDCKIYFNLKSHIGKIVFK